jgi:hypothetical protein
MMLASLIAIVIPGLQGVGLAMRAFSVGEVTALGLGLTDAALLSAAIDLLDAGIYIAEGNTRMAGLSVLFAIIPFAIESSVIKNVFKAGSQMTKDAIKFLMACPDFLTKTVTTMSMKELAEYTKMMLKPEIQAALKIIAENGSKLQRLIKEGAEKIKSVGSKKFGTKTVAEYTSAALNFSANGLKTVGVPLVKAGATLGGYLAVGEVYNYGVDKVNEIAETPKSVVERIIGKGSWEIVKSQFMSDGSVKDNNLLKLAVLSGWTPGMPVPTQFQTDTYKKSQEKQKSQTKTVETESEKITSEDIEKIVKIVKSSESIDAIINEENKKTEKKVHDFVKIKIVTDQEFEEIRRKAIEEVSQEEQKLNNESKWIKFLKTNHIVG